MMMIMLLLLLMMMMMMMMRAPARRRCIVQMRLDGARMQQPDAPRSINLDKEFEETNAAAVRQQRFHVL
jgi:hypothetical protein